MSNTAKFTKGPWGVEVGCSQAFVTTKNNIIHEANVDVVTGCRDERVANAHLIAAAPKMYERLCNISKGGGARVIQSLDKDEIKELLAEARGES